MYRWRCVCDQDYPNAALECNVDGVPTTAVVIAEAPALMTDESGVRTVMYARGEILSMTRGGPSPLDASASPEDISDDVLVCDAGSTVSLFIDSAADLGECPPQTISCPALGSFCFTNTRDCPRGYVVSTVEIPFCDPTDSSSP